MCNIGPQILHFHLVNGLFACYSGHHLVTRLCQLQWVWIANKFDIQIVQNSLVRCMVCFSSHVLNTELIVCYSNGWKVNKRMVFSYQIFTMVTYQGPDVQLRPSGYQTSKSSYSNKFAIQISLLFRSPLYSDATSVNKLFGYQTCFDHSLTGHVW